MQIDADIIMLPVNEIIPYWRNPRKNDKTVDALVDEIALRGFNVPIVVDANNVVVKGHARLKAAKRLGMDKVPCIRSSASEDVIKADRIADNKIQEMSSWDFGKLNLELGKISDTMQFKTLFIPDDVVGQEQDIPEVQFEAVKLDFSQGEYGEEYQSQSPQSAYAAPAYDGGYGDGYAAETPSANPEPPQEHRKLKTLCPYCGEVVFVTL